MSTSSPKVGEADLSNAVALNCTSFNVARYLAMFLYSGQSEVGYELFYFHPHLQHISSFGYVFGEGSGPVFSFDERWLA